MIREDLFKMHEAMVQEALTLMKGKNQDYCKEDAFTNLVLCQAMGICSAEEGVVIRMTDKLSRLSSVLTKGAQIKTESIKDTCLDLINYSVLLYALHADRQLRGEITWVPKNE